MLYFIDFQFFSYRKFHEFDCFIVSPQAQDGAANKDGDEPVEEEVVTKPPLTGIPQIDYVWDPNLPRELNGYGNEARMRFLVFCWMLMFMFLLCAHLFRFNLSSYPFLSSVPDSDDIDFKCDGLHDGFYASIKYNCQVGVSNLREYSRHV